MNVTEEILTSDVLQQRASQVNRLWKYGRQNQPNRHSM